MSVTITPSNTTEILARQFDDLRRLSRQAMKDATKVAADEARHLAPGSISEHIDTRLGGSPGRVSGSVFPTQDFAKYVEEGTGMYVEFHQPIRPVAARRAQNPRAALKIANGTFRRSVKGQRPQKFMERARDAAEPRVAAILEGVAVEVTQALHR